MIYVRENGQETVDSLLRVDLDESTCFTSIIWHTLYQWLHILLFYINFEFVYINYIYMYNVYYIAYKPNILNIVHLGFHWNYWSGCSISVYFYDHWKQTELVHHLELPTQLIIGAMVNEQEIPGYVLLK